MLWDVSTHHDVACDHRVVGTLASSVEVDPTAGDIPSNIAIDHRAVIRVHVKPMIQTVAVSRCEDDIASEQPLAGCAGAHTRVSGQLVTAVIVVVGYTVGGGDTENVGTWCRQIYGHPHLKYPQALSQ